MCLVAWGSITSAHETLHPSDILTRQVTHIGVGLTGRTGCIVYPARRLMKPGRVANVE